MMSLKSRRRSAASVVTVMVAMLLSVSVAVPANAAVAAPPAPTIPTVFGNVAKALPTTVTAGTAVVASGGVVSGGAAVGAAGGLSLSGLLVGAGIATSITCIGDEKCWSGDNALAYSLNKTYPLADVMRNWEIMNGGTFTSIDNQTNFTDSYGNRFIPFKMGWSSSYATIFNGAPSGPYAGPYDTLFVPYQWVGPATSISTAINYDYELQCKYSSGSKLGQAFWIGKIQNKVVANFGSGGNINTGTKGLVGYTAQNCGPSDGSGNWYPVGIRTFNELHDASGNIKQADSTNLNRPQNMVSWSATVSGPASPSSTTYTATQQCVKPDGSIEPLSSKVTGASSSITIPSCKEAGIGDYSKGLDITFDDGKNLPQDVVKVRPKVGIPASCDPAAGGTLCDLSVWVNGKQCTTGDAVCSNWSEIARSNPESVECKLGPNVVAAGMCNGLERAYGARPAQLNDANADGDPSTGGQDYWIENTRNPDGSVKPTTRPSNGVETGTGGFPSSGTQPSYDECLAKTWSWNPVDWVAVPVGCSINEAFVPKQSVQARLEVQKAELQAKLEGKGIAPAINAFSGTFATLGSVGGEQGCKGPHVYFPLPGGLSFDNYPLDACAEPMRGFAAFGNAIASLSIVIFGGLAVIRAIGRGFGFEFGMGGK